MIKLDFYEVQKRRAVELADAICSHFGIPRALGVGSGTSAAPVETASPTRAASRHRIRQQHR